MASCLVTLLAVIAAPTQAAQAPDAFKPFAPDSVWNLPLRDDTPTSPSSDAQIAWLGASMAAHGGWINSTNCGMPLYWADLGTPTVKVELDHPSYQDPALMRAWSAVPIPADARPASCSDKNFAVAQVQPDGRIKEWEFWAATKRADGSWVAQWGGAMDDMRADRGVASDQAWRDMSAPTWTEKLSTVHWNVTATSISQNAGVITQAELRAGRVDHALAMALNDAAKDRWTWPAQRSDGGSMDPAAIPEGARLRLPSDLDLSKRTMTPMVRMLAEAAQAHGIVIRDRTYDANVIYAEPPAAGAADAVTPLLAGQSPATAMRAFPWDRLQVVDAPVCTDGRGCKVTPEAVIQVDRQDAVVGDALTLDTTGSVLDQPRTQVRWDLDGDGSFEVDGGTAVKRTVTLDRIGSTRFGVQIITRDGATTTAAQTVQVGRAAPEPTPTGTPEPMPTSTPEPMPTPTPTPTPTSTPEPTPTSTPEPTPTTTPDLVPQSHPEPVVTVQPETAPIAQAAARSTERDAPAATGDRPAPDARPVDALPRAPVVAMPAGVSQAVTVVGPLRLTGKAAKLLFPVRCGATTGSCATRVVVRLAGRTAGLRRGTKLGAIEVRMPASTTSGVRVRLTGRSQRALQRAGLGRLRVSRVASAGRVMTLDVRR